jgi:uncharacterized protein YbaP (TraB family)
MKKKFEFEKRIIYLAICFVSMISFSTQAQQEVESNQLLWQITGKNLKKPSYLFGSFHSNDPRVFRFTDSTYAALQRVDAVVLEADVYSLFNEVDTRVNKVSLRFDSRGNPYTIDSKASSTRYGSEDGRPQFQDAFFQQIAYNSGKRFFALETIESQLDVFDEITGEKSEKISLKQSPFSQEILIQSYLKGDIENLRLILISQLQNYPNAYQKLISNRNQNMLIGIDSLMKKQSLFIAVGAGHLAGPDGLISLLRAKGYVIKSMPANYSSTPTESERWLKKQLSYTHVDTNLNFEMIFPGKPLIEKFEKGFRLTYQELGQGNTYWIEVTENQFTKDLSLYLDELFFSENEKTATELYLPNKVKAFQGLTEIYGVGYCWRRVFIYKGMLFKITCFGGNKFMHSDRPQNFFNRLTLLD